MVQTYHFVLNLLQQSKASVTFSHLSIWIDRKLVCMHSSVVFTWRSSWLRMSTKDWYEDGNTDLQNRPMEKELTRNPTQDVREKELMWYMEVHPQKSLGGPTLKKKKNNNNNNNTWRSRIWLPHEINSWLMHIKYDMETTIA